jgi:hypothetical protein
MWSWTASLSKSDVVRWVGFVFKSQLEAKLLGVELNRSLDIPRTKNRVGFFEHCGLPNTAIRGSINATR